MNKIESMTQAEHAAQFLAQHLREAASAAGAVEGRALMPMISRAAELAAECARMLADMHEDGAEVARYRETLRRIAEADPKEWCAATMARLALDT